MEAALQDPESPQRFAVYDEAWRTLREPSLLARMQSQWKLARALGICNMMIIHALSDLDSVGEANSQSRNLAPRVTPGLFHQGHLRPRARSNRPHV
jgi:hypothetical protein